MSPVKMGWENLFFRETACIFTNLWPCFLKNYHLNNISLKFELSGYRITHTSLSPGESIFFHHGHLVLEHIRLECAQFEFGVNVKLFVRGEEFYRLLES